MKRFIYEIFATILMPVVLVGAVIYGLLYVLSLLFATLAQQLEKGMRWVDRNVTSNIRE